jgi:putative phage-type endonuclease
MSTTEDKAVQTNEEDFLESDSDSDSTNSTNSFFLNETESEELSHTIYELIDQYIKDHVIHMSKLTFMTELIDDISHVVFQQLTDADILKESNFDQLYMFISEQCNHWFLSRENITCPLRHLPHTKENILVSQFDQHEEFAIQYNTDMLYEIRQKDDASPEQRTQEWYICRYNMLTSSNIWQALSTECQRNRLIYEKCKPLDTRQTENKWISTQGSLHWGVKYEPLTVMIYEHITNTKIGNFGCIQHPDYPFLGASPDGIVMNPESPLYGRLVEIKNIFNREMDGIPSEAYWTQTQIQMQCCDLEACDFVETRFKEYETKEEFIEDCDSQIRGIILEFILRDSTSNIPLYKYSPIALSWTQIQEWIHQTTQDIPIEYILFKTHYWNLNEIAMTTILKNDAWFQAAIPVIKETWETILKERVDGYEHRAPKKKVPKDVIVIDETVIPNTKICIIKLTEEEKMDE